MKETNYYASYFDDESSESNTQKPPQAKKKEKKFEMPLPPKKIIKDVQDLKKLAGDSELMYEIPDQACLGLQSSNLPGDILMAGGEEYKVIGYQDLKMLMGSDLNTDAIESNLPPEEQIAEIEKEFEVNQQDYNVLFKLIYLYRKYGYKEKLKDTREYTIALFPLSDDMWKEWINDERDAIKMTPQCGIEQKYSLISLFKRAFRDFKYFKICKKYLKFLISLRKSIPSDQYDNFPELKLEAIRNTFEKFLEIWGLDFNLSTKLFDLYLNFENENLLSFAKSNDKTNYDKTEGLIRSIWRRRLSFPHVDLDIVWMDYKKWEKNPEELKKCEEKYTAASKLVNDFINFEERFSHLIDETRLSNDSQKLCQFLRDELPKIGKKYFNYIRLYMEKALELNCDDEDIWQLYFDYTTNLCKTRELKLELLERACKCCYDNILFWIYLLRELEANEKPTEEIQAKIKEAFCSSNGDPEFRAEMWKYSLEYYCRIFDSTVEQVNHIRSLFDTAISDIESNCNRDYLSKLYHIWVEFEVYKVKNQAKMNEIMDKVVKADSSISNWRAYIYYQKFFGDISSIRKTYKRAVEYCKEEKKLISENWISWEKIFGTVANIENAFVFTKKKIPEESQENKSPEEVSEIDKGNENEDAEMLDENKNAERKIIVKNLPDNINESELEKFVKNIDPFLEIEIEEIRLVRDSRGNSRGFAFIDMPTVESAEECAKKMNNQILNGNVIKCAISKPPVNGENDKRTIYVNNISFKTTEESIKDAFAQYGDILDIRILYDSKTRKPRGYCYVEFADEDAVNKVLANKSNFIIDNRKVIVKQSMSVLKMRNNVKNVVHVSNLPFKLKEKDLKDFFVTNGINSTLINDCLIVKDDDGRPKGFGFVELVDEDSLKKALALSGQMIKNRPVIIKQSKRNITKSKKRKASEPIDEQIKRVKKQKTEPKEIESSQRQDMKITQSDVEPSEITTITKESKRLSNQDFRKFLNN